MDVDTFRRLLTPTGQELLAEVHDRAGIESDHALGARLREVHDGDLVAAAVTQNHLRGLAVDRFGSDTARMYFTHDTLEQTSRARVADHRAQRMRALGATRVVDLGCGLGGDLVAFARAGLDVRGVDIDPVRVEMARANLDALGLTGSVQVGDARDVTVDDDEAVFCHPDRRTSTGHVAGLSALTPSWEFVLEKLRGRAVASVMTGLAHDDIPANVEAEWVSDGSDLVECCLWGRDIATDAGHRRATLLPAGDSLLGTGASCVDGPVGRFLYEPDDAVIRAGLVPDLAETIDGWQPDPLLHWISSDTHAPTPFAQAFSVVDEVPFRTRQMRIALADRDIGPLTVKRRGMQIRADDLIAKLALDGSQSGTLVLTRVARTNRAFLVEPIPS